MFGELLGLGRCRDSSRGTRPQGVVPTAGYSQEFTAEELARLGILGLRRTALRQQEVCSLVLGEQLEPSAAVLCLLLRMNHVER